MAQLVEHILGKDEVIGSTPISSSIFLERYRSGHNEAVLKTVWGQLHKGSNPFLSAKHQRTRILMRVLFFYPRKTEKNQVLV